MPSIENLRKSAKFFREAGANGATREQLARHFQVSLRTADRHIEDLQDQGAKFEKVRQDRSPVSRFVMTRPPTWGPGISAQGRLALQVAALAVEQGGSQHFRSLLTRLESMAEEQMTLRDRNLFSLLSRRVLVQGGVEDPVEPDDTVFERILKGLGETGVPHRLEVTYQGPSTNRTTTHSVVPWGITQDLLSGGTFLLGWNTGKGSLSYLRLSRIESVEVRERNALPHPDLVERAALYQIGGWFSTATPFEVTARIRGANWIRAFQEARPNLPDFQITVGRGTADIRFMTNSLHGAKRWLLQMGACVEVLGPGNLRQEMNQELEQARAVYEG